MRRGILTIGSLAGGGLALLLGACSGSASATNPAVAACLGAAGAAGYDQPAQHQVTPAGDGRYTIELNVSGKDNPGTKTCKYDPKTGAHLD